MARSPLTAAPPAKNARLRGEPVARAVFADLPARYDRLANLLSFGQDRRWRRVVVEHTAAGSPHRGVRYFAWATPALAVALVLTR
jgi:ubiE/COQ5 methyltransferase family